jgi:hypothetical protein
VGLLIRNHLDQSLQWPNQKHWIAVRSYLLHSFLHVHRAVTPFTSHGNLRNYVKPKPFSWAKLAYLGFSSYNFNVQDHIPSTIGDILSKAWGGGCYQNEEYAHLWVDSEFHFTACEELDKSFFTLVQQRKCKKIGRYVKESKGGTLQRVRSHFKM